MKRTRTRLLSSLAALLGVAAVVGIGVCASPASAGTVPSLTGELWAQWSGTGAPWPRQIQQESKGYVCLGWMPSNLTGANDPNQMQGVGYFAAGGGAAPQMVTPVAYIYTRTDGSVLALPTNDAQPEGWNGVPPIRYIDAAYYGGSGSYQPPTQIMCTQTVSMADSWPDDSATLTGNCSPTNLQGGPPDGQQTPYVWSSQANGQGGANYYQQLESNPNFIAALKAAIAGGLASADTKIGTWTIINQLIKGTFNPATIVTAGGVSFLTTAVNDVWGAFNAAQSGYFTSTAWTIESSNYYEFSWVVSGPPGTTSNVPGQITVEAVDDFGTLGSNVAMGFQCSGSPSPVGAPLNLAQSVINGETPILNEQAAHAAAPSATGKKAVFMSKRPNGWFDMQSLGALHRNHVVNLNLSNSPQLVSPGRWASTVYLNGGNDRAAGGGGNDRLYGGLGNDVLYGGAQSPLPGGRDFISGGPGRDLVSVFDNQETAAARDVVSCGPGTDYVQADVNDFVSSDCEFVFRGPASVRAVRTHFRASPNKAAAFRTIGQVR